MLLSLKIVKINIYFIYFRNFAAESTITILKMRRLITIVFAMTACTAIHAEDIMVTVSDTRCQTVTGFGAASCFGAMEPYAYDTKPVKLLYGDESEIGLNIMRMEISPNFEGDVNNGWDTPYDWNGSLPSALIVKERGGIVFGTPWSPPGAYKTNGTPQGGKVNDKDDNDPQNQRGKLRKDRYGDFFLWLNMFLKWMHDNGVDVDAVSIQNEPDWWVNYSGCLYEPEEQLDLVKNYAHLLDRETYKGVRLISAEPLGFDPQYSNKLLRDETARNQIDIIAGHIYGHPPFGDKPPHAPYNIPDNMHKAAKLAQKYGKELWMTEHSVTESVDRLPNWDEQLEFAQELNECMLVGCTGYIYWYMRAHWSFVSTGESKYGTDNRRKNKLLPRAYIISHFAKHVTGSTRLESTCSYPFETNADIETSAYIKGDSVIVMAINATDKDDNLEIKLPYSVKSGEILLSTGNEIEKLCQKSPINIGAPVQNITVSMPAKSLNTYIFMLEQSTGIKKLPQSKAANSVTYYDLQGRQLKNPHGLCIEKRADGSSKRVYIKQ